MFYFTFWVSRNRVKYLKLLASLFAIGCVCGLLMIAGMYFYVRPDLPSVEILKDIRLQTPLKVYTQDGKLISQFGVKKRIPLTLEQIPQPLIDAILATEDSRFYDHPGIDPVGILRAVVTLVATGEKQQGGSTLTMQLARGFFLSREKAFLRKIKEIFIAWHIERLLTKDEILTLYLNKNELGHRAFGVGAAAQVYYGKEIHELTLAQMAMIAGLNKAPSTLNPITNPERALDRRRVVLGRMLTEGYITKQEYDVAYQAPVTASKHGAEIELDAPYLADMLYQDMVQRFGKEEAETGGYSIYATVPSSLQVAAQQAVMLNLHDYDERHGYKGPIKRLWDTQALENNSSLDEFAWTEDQMRAALSAQPSYGLLTPAVVTKVHEQSIEVFKLPGDTEEIDWFGLDWARPFITDVRQGEEPKMASDIVNEGELIWIRRKPEGGWQLSQLPEISSAFVAMDPSNGAVRAIVGGYSFYQSQFNRALQAKRQVGSNIKPFLYSSALEHGYTLASIINDAPINQISRSSGTAWRPKNSPAVYDGPIRMRQALGRSKNVVSVRLMRGVGLDNVINHLGNFGFDPNELPRDESLSLGSASLTPLELVTGFAAIANGGYGVQSHFVERITREDITVFEAQPSIACDDCLVAQTLTIQNDGQSNEYAPKVAEQVISDSNAFLVSEMMRTAVKGEGSFSKKTYWQGTGWRARNILQREDLYGKTGTTNEAKDTWFSGFAGNLVATAWVGFDDPSRVTGRVSRNRNLLNRSDDKYNWMGNAMFGGEDGARVAQPAWIRFMQVALDGQPERDVRIPESIVSVRIDRTTGKLTNRTDHTSLFEFFKVGTEPDSYVLDDEIVDPLQDDTKQTHVDDDIF